MQLNANDVWKIAYAQTGMTADDVTDFTEETVCGWFTVLLSEALDTENNIREAEGRERLAAAPVIRALDQDIDYSPQILVNAVTYGLGEKLWQDDEKAYNARDYRARFINALAQCGKAVPIAMEDYYA